MWLKAFCNEIRSKWNVRITFYHYIFKIMRKLSKLNYEARPWMLSKILKPLERVIRKIRCWLQAFSSWSWYWSKLQLSFLLCSDVTTATQATSGWNGSQTPETYPGSLCCWHGWAPLLSHSYWNRVVCAPTFDCISCSIFLMSDGSCVLFCIDDVV